MSKSYKTGLITPQNLNLLRAENRRAAAEWARAVLADDQAIILDTETTGLHAGAEIVEITIIESHTGQPLLDTLVKPKNRIPRGASAIHGITLAEVTTAPIWPELHQQVGQILKDASQVVIYNADFDIRLLRQTRDLYALPPVGPPRRRYQCAMKYFARFVGQWDPYRQDFKWQPLRGGNHRALGDCLATLKTLETMAGADSSRKKSV